METVILIEKINSIWHLSTKMKYEFILIDNKLWIIYLFIHVTTYVLPFNFKLLIKTINLKTLIYFSFRFKIEIEIISISN